MHFFSSAPGAPGADSTPIGKCSERAMLRVYRMAVAARHMRRAATACGLGACIAQAELYTHRAHESPPLFPAGSQDIPWASIAPKVFSVHVVIYGNEAVFMAGIRSTV